MIFIYENLRAHTIDVCMCANIYLSPIVFLRIQPRNGRRPYVWCCLWCQASLYHIWAHKSTNTLYISTSRMPSSASTSTHNKHTLDESSQIIHKSSTWRARYDRLKKPSLFSSLCVSQHSGPQQHTIIRRVDIYIYIHSDWCSSTTRRPDTLGWLNIMRACRCCCCWFSINNGCMFVCVCVSVFMPGMFAPPRQNLSNNNHNKKHSGRLKSLLICCRMFAHICYRFNVIILI